MLRYLIFDGHGGGSMSHWIAGLPFTGNSNGLHLVYSIAETGDGGVVLAATQGETYPIGFVARYSSTGVLEKVRNVQNSTSKFGGGVDSSGNPLIFYSSTNDSFSALNIMSQDLGSVTLSRFIGRNASSYNGAPCCVARRTDGSFLWIESIGSSDIVAVSLNSTASAISWQYNYDYAAAGSVAPYHVAIDSDGSHYISGHTQEGSTYKSLLLKTDNSGAVLWARTQSSVSGNVSYIYYTAQNMCIGTDGGVYISGGAVNSTRAFIAKYNSSGTIQWQRYVTCTRITGPGALAHYGGSTYFMFPSANNNMCVFKYNSDGSVAWKREFYILNSNHSTNKSSCRISIADGGESILISYSTVISNGDAYSSYFITAKLPADGTGTGTYGPMVYRASTVAENTGSLTLASPTVSAAAATYYNSAMSPVFVEGITNYVV